MATGTVRRFFDDKGYGFIQPDDNTTADLVFHVKDAPGLILREGLRVNYEASPSSRHPGRSLRSTCRRPMQAEARCEVVSFKAVAVPCNVTVW